MVQVEAKNGLPTGHFKLDKNFLFTEIYGQFKNVPFKGHP